MFRKLVALSFVLVAAISVADAADNTSAPAKMPASEIVSKNISARGGLQQWRAVQTMTMEGKMGAGGNQRAPVPEPLPGKKKSVIPTDIRPKDEVMLPFTMDLQRPRKERVEILFNGKTALQVFDGSNGWKLRPYLNRLEVEPFSADELKLASMQADLDGYLVDYAAKGTQIDLEGMEKVGDHENYKLKLSMKDGHSLHVWIDAQTYLETKVEGQPRRLDGVEHPVEIYYKDYRAVSGLQIPFLLETHVLPVAKTAKVPVAANGPIPVEKIVIDKVQVNPKLDASLFVKPQVETASINKP